MNRRRIPPIVVLVAALVAPTWGAAPTAESADAFELPADLATGWYARIDTSSGTILVRLAPGQSPQAVAHFAALANGTYAWAHPVTGEPEKRPFFDEIEVRTAEAGRRFEIGPPPADRSAPQVFVPLELGPLNFHGAGRLGLVRLSGGRITPLQFFVTASALPWLSPSHACIGEVVAGRKVVWAISEVKTHGNGQPIEPVVIRRVRVFAVGEPPALAEPVPFEPKPVSIRPVR